jgi:hypothetical protein
MISAAVAAGIIVALAGMVLALLGDRPGKATRPIFAFGGLALVLIGLGQMVYFGAIG